MALCPRSFGARSVVNKLRRSSEASAAATTKLIAIGKVIQPGKTLAVCEGSVYDGTGEKPIAKMTATIMTIGNK